MKVKSDHRSKFSNHIPGEKRFVKKTFAKQAKISHCCRRQKNILTSFCFCLVS